MVIKEIQEAMCAKYNISREELLSSSRKSKYILPRHMAMYLCRKEGYSFPAIAFYFKRKDHTTVMYAVKKIEKLLKGVGHMTTKHEELYEKAFENYLHTGNEDGLAELSKKVFDAVADNGYFLPPYAQLAISKHLSKHSIIYKLANKVNISLETTAVEFKDPHTHGSVTTVLNTMPHESKPSKKMIADSSCSLTDYITLDAAHKFELILNKSFIHGEELSNEPRGILTYPIGNDWRQIEQINSGINGKITGNGLIKLQNSLMQSYQKNASWLTNRENCEHLKELRDSNGRIIFNQDKPLLHMLGAPVHFCENMPIVSSDTLSIAYGDFDSAYTVFEHPLVSVVYNPFDEVPAIVFGTIKNITGHVVNFDAIKILKLSV